MEVLPAAVLQSYAMRHYNFRTRTPGVLEVCETVVLSTIKVLTREIVKRTLDSIWHGHNTARTYIIPFDSNVTAVDESTRTSTTVSLHRRATVYPPRGAMSLPPVCEPFGFTWRSITQIQRQLAPYAINPDMNDMFNFLIPKTVGLRTVLNHSQTGFSQ